MTDVGAPGPARPGPALSNTDQYIGYLVGWRDGLPVMTVYGLDAPDEASLAKLHPDGRYETLLRVASNSLISCAPGTGAAH